MHLQANKAFRDRPLDCWCVDYIIRESRYAPPCIPGLQDNYFIFKIIVYNTINLIV